MFAAKANEQQVDIVSVSVCARERERATKRKRNVFEFDVLETFFFISKKFVFLSFVSVIAFNVHSQRSYDVILSPSN